ncbi:MAG: terminase family protein [Gemmatimonadota bacterium]|nr:terminase family protein [Gemmatimonadota bacterium]
MASMTSSTLAEGLRERLAGRIVLQPHQIPPWRQKIGEDAVLGFVMMAGRGAGKSFAAMWELHLQLSETPNIRARVIAPTLGDGIAAAVDGPNGLLALSKGQARWLPSAPGGACVRYPNGSRVWIIGTPTEKDVDRLRALTNIDFDVFEEFFANPCAEKAYEQASLSRRRGSRRWLISSTPRPHALIKKWEKDERVVIRRGTSMDNKHIPLDWLNTLNTLYKGTRLYRQEVLGEVIEDVEGALWKVNDLERSRVQGAPSAVASICDRIVVGVDPPTGNGTCGIVVVGQDANGHLYVLDDRSVDEASPQMWAARVKAAADTYDAIVVAEINQGGQMVKEVINSAGYDLPIHTVNATKNKKTRAEPIALLWEVSEQIVHMVGQSVKLEDELCEWVPGESPKSPDRLDAMVWACWYMRSRHTATVRGSTLPSSGPVGLATGLSSVRMGRY